MSGKPQAAEKRQRGIDSYFGVVATKRSTGSQPKTTSEPVIHPEKKDVSSTTNSEFVIPEGVDPLYKLEYENMHPSWLNVLQSEFKKEYFLRLKRFLEGEKKAGKTIFPPEKDVYSWSKYTPADQVKVVIIGQDPYHNFNQAHGLCFSVLKGNAKPPSLRNMYKELEKEYPGFAIPNHGYLGGWAAQGVLLLNAVLTVEAHKADSHASRGWEQFTDAVIKYLSDNTKDLVFILWGSKAQKKGQAINKSKHLVLKGVHPSPLSASRGFFGCNHFKETNDYLVKNHKDPINWQLLDDTEGIKP